MKKQVLFAIALLFAGTITAFSQGGQRRTVAERVEIAHQKIDSAFKLASDKQTVIDSAFANYFRNSDKVREELMSGGERPDFQLMRDKMQPHIETRDNQIKTVLTEDQFKKFKTEIEPLLMPRRGQGGGNRSQR